MPGVDLDDLDSIVSLPVGGPWAVAVLAAAVADGTPAPDLAFEWGRCPAGRPATRHRHFARSRLVRDLAPIRSDLRHTVCARAGPGSALPPGEGAPRVRARPWRGRRGVRRRLERRAPIGTRGVPGRSRGRREPQRVYARGFLSPDHLRFARGARGAGSRAQRRRHLPRRQRIRAPTDRAEGTLGLPRGAARDRGGGRRGA